MKKVFAVSALFAALAINSFAALNVIESARVHSAAGAFGCTVSGATVATPSVITCAAAHNLIDGDQVQITGIVGTTTDNTLAYVKVTGYSATTFGIYSDAALATGIAGVGTYSSGGKVSTAYDISGLSGAWTLRARIEKLTAGKKVLVSIQGSTDGFVSDVITYAVWNMIGSSPAGCVGVACGPMVEYTVRGDYLLPSAYVGITNGRLRLNVQSIDSATSATVSLFLEQ